ncbi:MAG: hypothetical protein JW969_17860, partial [Spirochaetales bacterium]|nr:hypothetical protein [Spirochaetales bacterium]
SSFIELNTGLNFEFPFGDFNNQGNFSASVLNPLPVGVSVPLSVLFRIIPGLQAGVKARCYYLNEGYVGVAMFGIRSPGVEIKYTSSIGLGGYVDLFFPYQLQNITSLNPPMYLNFAAFYDNTFGSLLAYGEIIYTYVFESDTNIKQDSITVALKPGYQVTDGLAVTLLAQFHYFFDQISNGITFSNTSRYSLWIAPGIIYKPMDSIELSLEVPVSVMGKSAMASWMVDIGVTLKLF